MEEITLQSEDGNIQPFQGSDLLFSLLQNIIVSYYGGRWYKLCRERLCSPSPNEKKVCLEEMERVVKKYPALFPLVFLQSWSAEQCQELHQLLVEQKKVENYPITQKIEHPALLEVLRNTSWSPLWEKFVKGLYDCSTLKQGVIVVKKENKTKE
jgi:hypothetical protein